MGKPRSTSGVSHDLPLRPPTPPALLADQPPQLVVLGHGLAQELAGADFADGRIEDVLLHLRMHLQGQAGRSHEPALHARRHGGPVAVEEGQHIGVDILVGALRGGALRLATLWSSLMATAAALIWVVNGWEVAMFNRMLGIVTEGHLEWPVYWLMLFLPLGGVLMLLTAKNLRTIIICSV